MTKASDNEFPSLLVKEGTAPSSPAAGDQRVYIDSSDHHLKRKNSSGTVTDIESGSGATPATVGCSVYNTTTQSISNNTDTGVTFNSEHFDTDGFHSTVSNTEKLTIPSGKDGKYLITASGMWATSNVGTRFFRLQKNGTTNLGNGAKQDTVPSGAFSQSVCEVVDLVAGDYITVDVYQSSGSSLNIGSTNDYEYTRLEIVRLGT